ncbi:MAG: cytidylyltransferase domain-containing protein [Acetatifactor sp.]
MEKIVAIMPIKLNNERLPGKNTMILGDKPLLQHELERLSQIKILDNIFVYCSDESVVPYLLKGITYLKRPIELDLPSSNFSQIFKSFMNEVDADVYVYAHATAPFVTLNSMRKCLDAVLNKGYDSAFCATRIQDFLWKDGKPLNFDATDIPRSQDIEPIFRETSGIYVFRREVFEKYGRRIGINPYVHELGYKEAIDINTIDDFELAKALYEIDI